MELQTQMRHLRTIYGEGRNRHFLPTFGDRVDFLLAHVGDLQDTVRRAKRTKYGPAIARVLAAIFVAAQYFDDKDYRLTRALSRKYSRHGCPHCSQIGCVCPPEQRKPAKLHRTDSLQIHWSLTEWFKHLVNIYGGRNQEKGIENVLNRLFKEVTELHLLYMEMSGRQYEPSEMEEKIYLELADVFSWVCGAAYLLKVEPEAQFRSRYGKHCPTCKHKPCHCPLDLPRASWLG